MAFILTIQFDNLFLYMLVLQCSNGQCSNWNEVATERSCHFPFKIYFTSQAITFILLNILLYLFHESYCASLDSTLFTLIELKKSRNPKVVIMSTVCARITYITPIDRMKETDHLAVIWNRTPQYALCIP